MLFYSVKKLKFMLLLMLLFFGNKVLKADITYTLHLGGVESSIAQTIANSMAEASWYFNTYGNVTKHCHVYYDPNVPTAQASSNGVITFGGIRNTRVAMHEILHTLGFGTYNPYFKMMTGGSWDGRLANAQIQQWGEGDYLKGDSHIFWPYGMNYDNEFSQIARQRTPWIATLAQCDLGINTSCDGMAPNGYSFAGSEGQNICPNGYYNIAYGVNGQFHYLYGVSGCTVCNNSAFGDSYPGVAKNCFIQQ